MLYTLAKWACTQEVILNLFIFWYNFSFRHISLASAAAAHQAAAFGRSDGIANGRRLEGGQWNSNKRFEVPGRQRVFSHELWILESVGAKCPAATAIHIPRGTNNKMFIWQRRSRNETSQICRPLVEGRRRLCRAPLDEGSKTGRPRNIVVYMYVYCIAYVAGTKWLIEFCLSLASLRSLFYVCEFNHSKLCFAAATARSRI